MSSMFRWTWTKMKNLAFSWKLTVFPISPNHLNDYTAYWLRTMFFIGEPRRIKDWAWVLAHLRPFSIYYNGVLLEFRKNFGIK